MKNWVLLTYAMIVFAFPMQGFCKNIKENNLENAYTVMILLESKKGKETELRAALLLVAENSRAEESCLEYCLYQDAGDPTKFGLYEKWKSKELHQEQFNKPYIQEFARKAELLLAKPYQSLFGFEFNNTNF